MSSSKDKSILKTCELIIREFCVSFGMLTNWLCAVYNTVLVITYAIAKVVSCSVG